jgi:protein O-GlcNAc transferase
MRMQCFIDGLPGLFEGWGTAGVGPRSPRFAQMLAQVRGMTSPGVLQLLNHAVSCLDPGEIYAEVGSFQGATLVGALLGQPQAVAYAADNFSQFDPSGANRQALRRNLQAHGLLGQVRFSELDFEDFLPALWPHGVRLGAYFYDGAHDYRSQFLGLLLAEPLLAERALIVVDDANFAAVRQAAWDFLACRPQASLLLDLPTPGNGHPSFWNGLLVLDWDQSRRAGADRAELRRKRQGALLESLSALERVNVRIEGDQLHVTPAPSAAGIDTGSKNYSCQ